MILDGFGLHGARCSSRGYSGKATLFVTIRLPGQIKLKKSSAIVVGAGGLGCPALQYLAAAGVGETKSLSFCLYDLVHIT